MAKVQDAMRVLASTGAAEQIKKLLSYREAFYALAGWNVGDYATLVHDLNTAKDGAWRGVPYLVRGSVGRIVEVDWSSHHKRVLMLWEPMFEASGRLRYEPKYSTDRPRGSVELLYPGGVHTSRNYPDVETRAVMQKRIDAFASGQGFWTGGYVPFTLQAPDNAHCYSMFTADVEHATPSDIARATGIMVQCLRCGAESPYATLPATTYEHPTGRRPLREGEVVSLPYKHCPNNCVEEHGLIILNPPWPIERETPPTEGVIPTPP
jgi:hypothetical protein